MRKTSRPKQAAVTPKWLQDHNDRIQQNAEDAICAVATGTGPTGGLPWSTDEAATHTELAIGVFNRGAAQLDPLYDFPLRMRRGVAGAIVLTISQPSPARVLRAIDRAIGILTFLSSRRDLRTDYADWMLALLSVMGTPSFERREGVTEFPRGHVWQRKLRKTKKGQRATEAGVLLDQNTSIAEDQLKQFRRELFRRQAELDQLVIAARKIDPTDLDLYVVNWPHHIVGHKFGPGVLVPINEPHNISDPAEADDGEGDAPATE